MTDQFDLETLGTNRAIAEEQLDKLYSTLKEHKNRLERERVTTREKFIQDLKIKNEKTSKKYEKQKDVINTKITYYEKEEEKNIQKEMEDVETNEDYQAKKQILDTIAKNKRDEAEQEYNAKLDKINNELDTKLEKLRLQFSKQNAANKYKDYVNTNLERLRKELKVVEDADENLNNFNDDDIPKTKILLNLEQDIFRLEEEYKVQKKAYDLFNTELNNEMRRMRLREEQRLQREQDEYNKKCEEHRVIREEFQARQEYRLPPTNTTFIPKDTSDIPIEVPITKTKKEEDLDLKASENRTAVTNFRNNMKKKYPGTKEVIAKLMIDGTVILSCKGNEGILYSENFKNEKEFSEKCRGFIVNDWESEDWEKEEDED